MTKNTSTDATDPNAPADPASGPDASPAEKIIAAFGGIRPMAHKLDAPVTTVQGWKKRGSIPENRHEEILAAARKEGIVLDATQLRAAADPVDPDAAASVAESPPADRTGQDTQPEAAEAPPPVPPPVPPDDAPKPEGGDYNRPPDPRNPPGAAATPVVVQQHRGGGVAWLALLLSLAAGAGLISYHLWSDDLLRQPSAGQVADRVSALDARLADAESRLGALAEAPDDAVAALEDRIAALEARPAPDDSGAPAAPTLAALGALRDRLSTLEGDLESLRATIPAPVDVDDVIRRTRAAAQPDMEDAAAAAVAPLSDRLDTLAGQIDGLSQDVQEVDNRLASLETARAALGDTRQALDGLSGRLGALETSVAALDQRLGETAAVAERDRAAETRAQALVLAVSQLRDATAGGAPYATALAAAQAAGDGADDVAAPLAALAARADSGVPGRSSLQADFPAMARAVRAADAVAPEAGWVDQALARLEGLVTIRPEAGEVDGDGTAAILARAEGRLAHGNLAGAVDALGDLDGAAADAAAGWIADAQARLALEDALQAVTGAAIARLGQTGSEAAARAGGDGQ